jgi:hypothetical protein
LYFTEYSHHELEKLWKITKENNNNNSSSNNNLDAFFTGKETALLFLTTWYEFISIFRRVRKIAKSEY